MADREDEIMKALAYSISMVYTILVDVCASLPVPIGLPADRNIPVEDVVPAIQRVAKVAQDQPMGAPQRVQLYSGCIQLLASIDLYALCVMRFDDYRAEGVGANLLYAERDLRELATWLVINESD